MADDPNDRDDDEIPLGSPQAGGSIFEQFQPQQVSCKTYHDGMPVEKDPPWEPKDAAPPPLTPQTMCCLAQSADPARGRDQDLPVCKLYKRQSVHNPDAPDRPVIMRFCCHESLRGVNGAALHVGDSAIYACEFRDPPDPSAEIYLDAVDKEKIELGTVRLEHEKRTGATFGYRMFPTLEDVKAGRRTVEPEDYHKLEDEESEDE